MSNSSVSGPYAYAVSIKFAPSSTARFKILRAFSRSGGQPQIPSPVRRIAPNPSRLTGKSPPMLSVEVSLGDVADKSIAALLAKTAAPPVSVVRRNSRRLIPLVTPASLAPKGFSFMAEAYVHMRPFHEASYTTLRFLRKSKRLAACLPGELLTGIDPFASLPAAL